MRKFVSDPPTVFLGRACTRRISTDLCLLSVKIEQYTQLGSYEYRGDLIKYTFFYNKSLAFQLFILVSE